LSGLCDASQGDDAEFINVGASFHSKSNESIALSDIEDHIESCGGFLEKLPFATAYRNTALSLGESWAGLRDSASRSFQERRLSA
jgi:hypothetical protein